MGCLMKSSLAILWVIFLSGCWVPSGWTYRQAVAAGESTVQDPSLSKPVKVYGVVELPAAMRELVRLELVRGYPPGDLLGAGIACDESTRAADLIRTIEVRKGWVYDPTLKIFYVASATHLIDAPDGFGRVTSENPAPVTRRPMLSVQFRFRRVSAGAKAGFGGAFSGDLGGNAGLTATTFSACLPEGVRKQIAVQSTRTYYEGVQSPEANDTPVVRTELKSVASGLSFDVLAARLPGELFRMQGDLSISAFVGTGLDQSTVQLPIEVDGPRHQWVSYIVIRGGDMGMDAAFRHFGVNLSGSADQIECQVRVD